MLTSGALESGTGNSLTVVENEKIAALISFVVDEIVWFPFSMKGGLYS